MCSKVIVPMQVIVLMASLFPLGLFGDNDYVPLNSLTLSSLYKDKTPSTKRPVPDKTWWTDLQEKREEYKAKRQKLKLQLQKQPSAGGDADLRVPPIPLKSTLLGNVIIDYLLFWRTSNQLFVYFRYTR